MSNHPVDVTFLGSTGNSREAKSVEASIVKYWRGWYDLGQRWARDGEAYVASRRPTGWEWAEPHPPTCELDLTEDVPAGTEVWLDANCYRLTRRGRVTDYAGRESWRYQGELVPPFVRRTAS